MLLYLIQLIQLNFHCHVHASVIAELPREKIKSAIAELPKKKIKSAIAELGHCNSYKSTVCVLPFCFL